MSVKTGSKNASESIRLFENPILEQITHVHPIIPLLLWGPVISFLLYRAVAVHGYSISFLVGLAFVAILTWTLAEYLLHRYVFHFPAKGPMMKRFVYLFHGIHHDAPGDATRLVMPPVPAIFLGIILFSLLRLALGPVLVEPFFAFFVVGYLMYDYTHYATHHFTPKTPWGKYIKEYHMLHHFQTPDARYGVSTPLWDFIIGTEESKVRPASRR